MGDRHLRKLLVVETHVKLYSMKSGKTKTALADWARSLLVKEPPKVVAVALANKMARIARAVMARSTACESGSNQLPRRRHHRRQAKTIRPSGHPSWHGDDEMM
ncbi:hypothetical protein I2H38_17925 [Microvirga sp. BT350]|uniref:Uncharacterized protein n=1 Tax=Microvirga alba TaxID=2791025 RepID=A0A931BWR0_9HYPH|nr:hypothetical protein [Microvirga alba]